MLSARPQRPDERELAAALRRLEPPDAAAAAERAWRRVEAGFEPGVAGRRAHRRRVAPVAAALALAAAVAISPPGEALAEWLRGATVATPRPPERTRAPLAPLPGDGALLARGPEGAWIVDGDGRRRALGRWADVAWSPRGRFVAAVRGSALAALDLRGEVRWSLERPYRLGQPAWSPDGQRIAYRSLDGLRVVAGDGTGDRLAAGPLGPAGPAWRPGPARQLAWADRRGQVRLIDADSGREHWRTPAGAPVRALAWAPAGRRLAVITRRGLRVLDGNGQPVSRIRVAPGRVATAAAFERRGRAPLAYVVHDPRTGRSLVRMTPGRRIAGRPSGVPRDHTSRLLAAVRGRLTDIAFAPGGGLLLVGGPAAPWLRIGSPYRLGGATLRDAPAAARIRGWCCPP